MHGSIAYTTQFQSLSGFQFVANFNGGRCPWLSKDMDFILSGFQVRCTWTGLGLSPAPGLTGFNTPIGFSSSFNPWSGSTESRPRCFSIPIVSSSCIAATSWIAGASLHSFNPYRFVKFVATATKFLLAENQSNFNPYRFTSSLQHGKFWQAVALGTVSIPNGFQVRCTVKALDYAITL